jgi:hypothetical protein
MRGSPEPAVRQRIIPLPDTPGETVGDRVLRSIALPAEAFDGERVLRDADDTPPGG